MSKEYSANIHDPNHTVNDYDLYFNGEPVSAGGVNIADVSIDASQSGDNKLVFTIPDGVGDNFALFCTCITTSGYTAPAFGTGIITAVSIECHGSTCNELATGYPPTGDGKTAKTGITHVKEGNKITITANDNNYFKFADFATNHSGFIAY